MAVGEATGEDRAVKAAEMAISNQLLDVTIDGARGILFNVTGGESLKLFEVNQAAAIIKETAHQDVNLIFGAVIDPDMGDRLRITVIATGFEGNSMQTSMEKSEARQNLYAQQRQLPNIGEKENAEETPDRRQPADTYEFPTRINTDDLDVPAFLRKRNQN